MAFKVKKAKPTIFRLMIGDTKNKVIGYKLIDAKEIRPLEKAELGSDRRLLAVLPTNLKGTVASRTNLPRSIRFGKGFG